MSNDRLLDFGQLGPLSGSCRASVCGPCGRRLDRLVDERVELVLEVEAAAGEELGHEHPDQPLLRVHPEAREIGAAPTELSHRSAATRTTDMLDDLEAQAETETALVVERADVVGGH